MVVNIKTSTGAYDVRIEAGALSHVGEVWNLARKVLVLTDTGVPVQYVERVAAACGEPTVVTVPMGEESKSFSRLEAVCRTMLHAGFTRTDAVVAVGGGVVGDLAGMVAALYMRGVDFYNIPTTLLSQVDSSVGGKTAVNLDGIKNCVGSFYPPCGVLIDPDVLDTLSPAQFASGMAEVIKVAVTLDEVLFTDLEADRCSLTDMIARSVAIKASVVAEDEHEAGLRRVLNFGHTIGHGIEHLGGRTHGACVALGMLPLCTDEVRRRLLGLYQRYDLPTAFFGDTEAVIAALSHDKKMSGDRIHTVYVPRVGAFEIQTGPLDKLIEKVREAWQ